MSKRKTATKFFKIALYLILTMSFLSSASAAPIITSNILSRVFLIHFKESVGTAFTIEENNRQYLITAKHIVPNIQENGLIEIYRDRKWVKLKIKPIYCKDSSVDIVILAPEFQLSATFEVIPTTVGMIMGDDIYFLGFPYGIHSEYENSNHYFPIAFIKKGILSAWDLKDKDRQILYLDGFNNPGFSGGPIVFQDVSTKKLKIAGVVSGYPTQKDDVFDEKEIKAKYSVRNNSGIVIGYAIEPALEAIKANPIGAIIKW